MVNWPLNGERSRAAVAAAAPVAVHLPYFWHWYAASRQCCQYKIWSAVGRSVLTEKKKAGCEKIISDYGSFTLTWPQLTHFSLLPLLCLPACLTSHFLTNKEL